MISEIVRNGHSKTPFAMFVAQLIDLVEQNLGASASVKSVSNVIKSQRSLAEFQATTGSDEKEKFAPYLRMDAAHYEQCIAETLALLNKAIA